MSKSAMINFLNMKILSAVIGICKKKKEKNVNKNPVSKTYWLYSDYWYGNLHNFQKRIFLLYKNIIISVQKFQVY